ncbi:MAG TPA: hypothetical protein VKM56_12260, partial [Verrucomicrobiae bacterium]|nr:hypothetical protein [Verrucomicrobiae bacterium]
GELLRLDHPFEQLVQRRILCFSFDHVLQVGRTVPARRLPAQRTAARWDRAPYLRTPVIEFPAIR